MKKVGVVLFTVFILFTLNEGLMGQVTNADAWINEFHYDNVGGDEGEFIEVVVKNSENFTSLNDFSITLYNGSNGKTYGDSSLDLFSVGDTLGDYIFYYLLKSGIQNGDPDGLALSYKDELIQFLSYEGIFVATEGPAVGITSTDVDVVETGNSSAPIGYSLQLTGSGYEYDDFSWSGPTDESPGSLNAGQYLHPTVQFSGSVATINEADETVTIPIKIENPDGNSVDVEVSFYQNNSTAEDVDFTESTSKQVSFDTNANEGDIVFATFALNDDSDYEGTETAVFILSHLSTSGEAKLGGQIHYTLTIEDDDIPNVVINEIHVDPANDLSGDANGDGERSSSHDEFIEIVNAESISINISGWSITDDSGIKHTFIEETYLAANGVAIIFGGGNFSAGYGGAIVQSSSLTLNNDGDTVTLSDASGNVIDSQSYGSEGNDDQSLVRSPDITGDFIKHSEVDGANGALFSPGTKSDGSLFTTSIVIEGNAGWRMLSAPVSDLSISALTASAPIQGFGDGHVKNFYTGYNGNGFTAPDDLSGNLNSGEGFILYFYNNTVAGSSTLPVIFDMESGTEPENDVTVNLHSSGDGWNLLGNPFQTAFDMNALQLDGGELTSSVGQIWSDESESYILTSTNDNKVAPGQGFFIQNENATSATFPVSGKSSGTRFYKSNHQQAFVQLQLTSESNIGLGLQQDLSSTLYFHTSATENWDSWDAQKLYPLKNSYSILNIIGQKGEELVAKAQDSRAFEESGEEVFNLNVESINVSPLQILTWHRSSNIPESWEFIFIDNKTGEELRMSEGFTYQFNQDSISHQKNKSTQSKLTNSLTAKEEETSRFTIKVMKNESVSIEKPTDQPKQFKLEQNYPNPFNPTTTINYSTATNGMVQLDIYNVMGQKVTTLVQENKMSGSYQVTWNAADISSGVYYYRLRSAGEIVTKKMTLIK